mgnify:CR=1 FL=1
MMKPNLIDRAYIFIMSKSKRVNAIIEAACGEAYDIGYDNGMHQMAKEVRGKKYANKVKKVIRRRYLDKNGKA